MLATTTLQLRSSEKLQAAMIKKGISGRGLAKQAGISQARIGQLVNGHLPATAAGTAVAIAAALDVEVKSLFSFPDAEALIRLGLIRG